MPKKKFSEEIKTMHPRNIYSKGLNFKHLLNKYPSLQPHFVNSLSGNLSYKFSSAEALSELTHVLLLEDFGLDVETPPCKLVPTLPLRLNYLLWVEDLVSELCGVKDNVVSGIDVGTGASCVFALLAAKKGWRMLATEASESSCEIAQRNIEKNNLGHLITLKLVADNNSILDGVVDVNTKYHFSMCNPPFFELDEEPELRTPHRNPPNNAPTGSKEELRTKGGEFQFVSRMVEDSMRLKDLIAIYTVMLGKRGSLKQLCRKLDECKVKSYEVNVFQQGKTTRWGLAWSFTFTLPPTGFKKNLKRVVTELELPAESEQAGLDRVKRLFTALEMTYEEVNQSTCLVKATKITWVNQRKLRRELQRRKTEEGPSQPKVAKKEDPVILEFKSHVRRHEGKIILSMYEPSTQEQNDLYQISQFIKNNFSRPEI